MVESCWKSPIVRTQATKRLLNQRQHNELYITFSEASHNGKFLYSKTVLPDTWKVKTYKLANSSVVLRHKTDAIQGSQ